MKNLEIGQAATLARTFTADDLARYAALAGIATAPRTVSGPLLGGMISCLLGTQLPGRGANWLQQKLAFPAPAQVGQAITATVEIVRLRPAKQLVNLRTTCTDPAGVVVCEGDALVYVQDVGA